MSFNSSRNWTRDGGSVKPQEVTTEMPRMWFNREIVLLPEGTKVANPTGPGWIEVTVTGHCSTSFINHFYTF